MDNNIKEQLYLLVKLQNIETEAVKIKMTLNKIPDKIISFDIKLQEFKKQLEDEESRTAELEKKYRDFESDLKIYTGKIEKSREKLSSVKTNKEYQSLLKEIEEQQTMNSRLEDEMLECLERIDGFHKSFEDKKDEYSRFSLTMNREKQELIHNEKNLNKKLAELEIKRADASGIIEQDLLKTFFLVKEKDSRGIGIVPVGNEVCLGCNVNLPPQLYNEIQRCGSLKFCPNCQRIVYPQIPKVENSADNMPEK